MPKVFCFFFTKKKKKKELTAICVEGFYQNRLIQIAEQ